MRCPSCNHHNRPERRFCAECGTALASACAACGTANEPGEKFCGGCGIALTISPAPGSPRPPAAETPKHLVDKILHSRSALEGERKQVTVLFADVKGSMELAEQLDPEEWSGIMQRFFAILCEGIARFEGFVDKFTGDGIMALFGAPIAHEDHAQRACYSALHLRDALRDFARDVKRRHGLDFATRIGINSGAVVVGRIGDDLRMDYTAQGHTVGLAQRMEALASAGSIYLSENTNKLVHGYFAQDDLGEFRLKGVAEPMHVYELSGIGNLRTRFDISRARGLSKFAGRAQEMRALEAALEKALAGTGQVFGLVADAGTGKSRLCFEFANACRAKGITVRATTGVAHGKAVPLLPVLDFYRAVFGIVAQDDARTARQKIAGTVVQSDESLVTSLPLLFDFLGVPDPERPVLIEPGPERQRALLALLKRMTLARSRREPAVILFEDLHWIDGATETFLENLVDAADASRTLLVVNFRPDYRAEWMRRSYYHQIALAPLDACAFADMLGETLGTDPSLGSLVDQIHGRSGGNPFFAEEIIQTLIESGALTGTVGKYRLTRSINLLEIPATVQLILEARIDRLGEREKNVLQCASVIGRDFSEPLLRRVAREDEAALGDALRALVHAEFLHATALYPEAQYAFKHPLTQEVALGSQLHERRSRVHAAVAQALLELRAGSLDEHAALLAHHFDAAGSAPEAAHWHERAAIWLEGRDPAAGMQHWNRLVELVGAEPESPKAANAALRACARIIDLGAMFGLDHAHGEELYRRGRALAARLAESDQEAALIAFFARYASISGHSALEVAMGDEALRAARRVTDVGVYADLVVAASTTIAMGGRLVDAIATLDSALAEGRATSATPVALARLLSSHATWLVMIGHLRDARVSIDRAAELLAGQRAVLGVLVNENARIQELVARGLPEGSLERVALQVARADESGAHYFRVVARLSLTSAHIHLGQPEAALAAADEGIEIVRRTGVGQSAALQLETLRARALLATGRVDLAREVIERVVAVPIPNPLYEGRKFLVHAEVLVAADAVGERTLIESRAAEMDLLAQSTGALPVHAMAWTTRAQLARALGDEDGWKRALREALRVYTSMDATGWMERIEQELAS